MQSPVKRNLFSVENGSSPVHGEVQNDTHVVKDISRSGSFPCEMMPKKRTRPKKISSTMKKNSPVERKIIMAKKNLVNIEDDSSSAHGEMQNVFHVIKGVPNKRSRPHVVKGTSNSGSLSCEMMPKKRSRPKKVSSSKKKNPPIERKIIMAKRNLVSVEDDSSSAHGEMQNVFHVIEVVPKMRGKPKKISSARTVVERNLFDDNDDLSSAHVEVPNETDADAVLLSSGSDATYKSNQTVVKRKVKCRPTKQKQNLSSMQDSLEEGDDKNDPSTEPKFPCSKCPRVFTKRFGLARHLNSRHSDAPRAPLKKFTCTECNKEFTRKKNLKQHMKIHMGMPRVLNKKYKCETCGKAFHGKSLLTIHLRVHTGEKPYSCEQCHKKFSTIYILKKHENTHTGLRPFHCEECGHRFTQKCNLMTHMKLHAKVKPYACSYCPKQFLQLGGLKAHMFHHTGENGFECEECGDVFNRKDRLQMHRRYVHENSRPFSCEKCEKAFVRIEDLNQHTLVHTGEKPFSCSVCNKRFSAQKALRLHLLTHTEKKPVTCEECRQIFIRKDRLVEHICRKHRDQLDKFEELQKNVEQLLQLLVNKDKLASLGWPEKPVYEVLESLISRCDSEPFVSNEHSCAYQMRENLKILFTTVINDEAIKSLLENHPVDDVILQILELAE